MRIVPKKSGESISSPEQNLSKICIYDASGKLVTRLSNRPGSGDYVWDCKEVRSGVYVYTVYNNQMVLKGTVVIH
jgi:hypothetical protein